MKPFRSGPSSKQPYFSPSQIEQICCDELRKEGLFPDGPEAIRIDRFIEKRFRVSPQYEELPVGVLGFTKFGKDGVKAVVISAALDAEGDKVAERRVRTTMAHEAGHGLLHAHLFALNEIPLHLFDKDSHSGDQILCRDVQGHELKAGRYDGRWWEVQANRAMSSLLCPRPLMQEAIKPFLAPAGLLGVEVLNESSREEAVRALADIFDVNPVVTRIRISELYPPQTGQLHL
ncbi:MAG TPA: hypothetical protein VNE63_05935 [Candidatus Acidoferrales bacterium]|nr:hypothetical protein [Candidatus Acidoferrales bacterium]